MLKDFIQFDAITGCTEGLNFQVWLTFFHNLNKMYGFVIIGKNRL